MTLSEEKNSIRAYISEKSLTPSVFTCWAPERMAFGPYRQKSGRQSKLLSPGDIERAFYAGSYADSDMFLLKAMHCFTYAPPECLLSLVRYWYRKEVREASREERPQRAIPSFEKYTDMHGRLSELARTGLIARYAFYPLAPRPGREGCPETIYKATGHSVGFYKKKLLENDMPYDPRDGYCNAEDAFSACLTAYACAAFLGSPFLKAVSFKRDYEIEKVRHKVRAEMVFHPEGASGEDSDETVVFLEGMTFRTNENLVTLKRRREYNEGRITELSEVIGDAVTKRKAFLILCLEDAAGLSEAAKIIRDRAPLLIGRTLLTTERVLYDADVFSDPANAAKCFLSLEENGVEGATGLYFLTPKEAGGSLSFRTSGKKFS